MTFSKCIGSLALLSVTEGARVSRKRHASSKFIAGVPVLNYDLAYEGEEALVEGESEGEWILMMTPGTSDSQIETMCQMATHGCNLAGHPDEGGVPFLEMRGTEQDLEAVIHTAPGAVQFIEPDQTISLTPEQPAPEAATWGLNRIRADQRGRSGSSVTVFVLDTGIRHSHNDFGGRASSGLDMTGGRPRVCNGDASCALDRQGHGTHCAGTAVGTIHGVAPGAKVQSVKVLSDSGSGSFSWSNYALDWMATSSVRPAVASMSLGGQGIVSSIRGAVDTAVSAGVTVVVAGGNSNSDACGFSPAYVPNAITVGSTDNRDRRSSFSNYGRCTNIWAPGSAVKSLGHRGDTATATFSGTSMACPHVSGAAALVLDASQGTAPAKVLQKMLDEAFTGAITDLKSGDTNALLDASGLR